MNQTMNPNRKNEVVQRRLLSVQCRSGNDGNGGMYVEGYASVFDSPTVLFEYDGIEYKEQICRGAFDCADMSDVILNYNHGGKVIARTRNNTLTLTVDDHGLHVRARLDGTEEGRRLYEEIQGGYIDSMSFRFTIKEESYDQEAHQWNVRAVKRLYDVSAVDIPAYEDTSVEARRAVLETRQNAIIAAMLRERVLIKSKIA